MADLGRKYVCRSDLALAESTFLRCYFPLIFRFLVAQGNIVPLGTTGKCRNIRDSSEKYNLYCIYRRLNNFCLGHFQCLKKYYSNQYWRKGISYFTKSTPGMIQNKITKTSISFHKSKATLHSSNQKNLRNKTCSKILVWIKKINLPHSEIIIIYYDHSLFSCIYMNYKYYSVFLWGSHLYQPQKSIYNSCKYMRIKNGHSRFW